MRIELSTKHIVLESEMKQSIESKFEHLQHFLKDDSARLNIEVINTTGEHHKHGSIFAVEARLHMAGGVIKAGKQGENILIIADKVKKEIERQVLKLKEKRQEDKRRTRRAVREARGKA